MGKKISKHAEKVVFLQFYAQEGAPGGLKYLNTLKFCQNTVSGHFCHLNLHQWTDHQNYAKIAAKAKNRPKCSFRALVAPKMIFLGIFDPKIEFPRF